MENSLNSRAKKIIQCPKCEKKYVIDPLEVSVKGVRITCPSCSKVFIVRAPKIVKKQKQDFIQCSICGQPPTVHLNTDKPMCERCYIFENEKAANSQKITEGKEALLRLDCVLSMLADGHESVFNLSSGAFYDAGVSFYDLSRKNFSRIPSMVSTKRNIISIDNLDEAIIDEALSRLDSSDFNPEQSSTDGPSSQNKKHLPPEEKPAYSPESLIPKPDPIEPAPIVAEPVPAPIVAEPVPAPIVAEPGQPELVQPEPIEPELPLAEHLVAEHLVAQSFIAEPPQAATPEPEAVPKSSSSVWKKLNIVTSGKLEETLHEEILSEATAIAGKWNKRISHKKKSNILYVTKPDAQPGQHGHEPNDENTRISNNGIISLIMVLLAEANKNKTKWFSPVALADRANDGFLSMARTAGKAVRVIHSTTVGDSPKTKQEISREKKKKKPGKTSRIRKIKPSKPTNDTPEENGSPLHELTAESIIERLTPEELDILIDEVTKESGVNFRDFMEKFGRFGFF